MPTDTPARAARRAEITRILARYPDLTPDADRELSGWYAREASSFDMAMLACDEAIAEPYRAWRAAHVDRIGPRDWLRGLGWALLVAALLAVLLWRAI